MKNLLVAYLLLVSLAAQAQVNYKQWQQMEQNNLMLQPRLGGRALPQTIKNSTDSLYSELLPKFVSARDASDYLIQRGFLFLHQDDLITAMHRYNQAYVLDSTNPNVYWGYGSVYATMGQNMLARKQYIAGLELDPESPPLLTGMGTTYLAEYYLSQESTPQLAQKKLDTALSMIQKSYSLIPEDGNTNYKLSICYYQKNLCPQAVKHLTIADHVGGVLVTQLYRNDLMKKCPAPTTCPEMPNGEYLLNDDTVQHKIYRTDDYQIEENLKTHKKTKIKLQKTDKCNYIMTKAEEEADGDKKTQKENLAVYCEVVYKEGNTYTVIAQDKSKTQSRVYEMTLQ